MAAKGLRQFTSAGAVLTLLSLLAISPAVAKEIKVCASQTSAQRCAFIGGAGLQRAIAGAGNGDLIRLGAGSYSFETATDVSYSKTEGGKITAVRVRAALAIDGRDITLAGEPGVLLDGGRSKAMSAIVVRDSVAAISGIEISGFRAHEEEDDIYDGHGIFVINGDVDISNVVISNLPKMSITARGDSDLDIRDTVLRKNHIGIWARESSNVSLRNVSLVGAETGIAAYNRATIKVYNSIFDQCTDDGLFAKHNAVVIATNTIISANAPYGLHALDESTVILRYGVLFANQSDALADATARIDASENVGRTDPMLDADFRPLPGSPTLGAGDPNTRSGSLKEPTIGLLFHVP